MRQSFKRLLSSILALVCVIAAFIIYFNLVQPEYDKVMELRGEYASLNEVVESQRVIIDTVEALVVKYDQSQAARQQIEFALPAMPKAAEALAQINGIVNVNRLNAQAFALMGGESSNSDRAREEAAAFKPYPVQQLIFQARLNGSYEDFKKFLDNLETNVRIFDVKTMSVQAAGKPNQDFYTFEMRIVAYHQNEK